MAPHRGHKYDSERTAEPPYISQPLPIQASTWLPWVRDTGSSSSDSRSLISPSLLNATFGSYGQTYDHNASLEKPGGRHSRRSSIWEIFINDPWVPGVIRIIMFALSCTTLGLSGRLLVLNTTLLLPFDIDIPVCQVSPIMAIVLAALAICYLPYIFYDEYFGGPVGIRSPLSKARLLFFDLTFVVLYAVNATLAADEAFTDGCTDVFEIERSVFAFIFVTTAAWIGTFSITLIRLIARIGAGLRTGRS